jgi:SAM-dependent methyltransferase
MHNSISRALLAALALCACSITVCAQQAPAPDYEPKLGQSGKDVIWVPTPNDVVERMLRMAKTTAADYVVDLGAGDGKITIAAAKLFKARALGIEYNQNMARFAQNNAVKAGVADRARIIEGDIFTTDFSTANVITMYLLPHLNLKLRPQLLTMRPGTRIVSHSFNMDDWEPDDHSTVDGRDIYLYVIPANAMGQWIVEFGTGKNRESFEMSLIQRYQKLEGYAQSGGLHAGLRDPRLNATEIRFSFMDRNGVIRNFTGQIDGPRMQGRFDSDTAAKGRWTAARK